MKFVIVGCGRVGAGLAEAFDNAGHDVVVIDLSTRAFDEPRLHVLAGERDLTDGPDRFDDLDERGGRFPPLGHGAAHNERRRGIW